MHCSMRTAQPLQSESRRVAWLQHTLHIATYRRERVLPVPFDGFRLWAKDIRYASGSRGAGVFRVLQGRPWRNASNCGELASASKSRRWHQDRGGRWFMGEYLGGYRGGGGGDQYRWVGTGFVAAIGSRRVRDHRDCTESYCRPSGWDRPKALHTRRRERLRFAKNVMEPRHRGQSFSDRSLARSWGAWIGPG